MLDLVLWRICPWYFFPICFFFSYSISFFLNLLVAVGLVQNMLWHLVTCTYHSVYRHDCSVLKQNSAFPEVIFQFFYDSIFPRFLAILIFSNLFQNFSDFVLFVYQCVTKFDWLMISLMSNECWLYLTSFECQFHMASRIAGR